MKKTEEIMANEIEATFTFWPMWLKIEMLQSTEKTVTKQRAKELFALIQN